MASSQCEQKPKGSRDKGSIAYQHESVLINTTYYKYSTFFEILSKSSFKLADYSGNLATQPHSFPHSLEPGTLNKVLEPKRKGAGWVQGSPNLWNVAGG